MCCEWSIVYSCTNIISYEHNEKNAILLQSELSMLVAMLLLYLGGVVGGGVVVGGVVVVIVV